MIAPAIAFPCLLAFWVFVGWRVRVEKGRVRAHPLVAYARAMRRLVIAFAQAMTPIVRHACEQIEAWNRGYAKIAEELSAPSPNLEGGPPS